jgi:hypothetical protein
MCLCVLGEYLERVQHDMRICYNFTETHDLTLRPNHPNPRPTSRFSFALDLRGIAWQMATG